MTKTPVSECESIWREFDDQICRGEMTAEELWQQYKRRSNYQGPDIDFIPFWVSHFQPILPMQNLVKSLSRERPVGIMTNIYPDTYPTAIKSGKMPQIEARVIQSCVIGSVKPELKIYQVAEQKANVSPNRLLLIDDNPIHIEAAVNRDWKGILFDRQNVNHSIEEINQALNVS